MKRGFIFDLDGVITDTAKFHYMAWKKLARSIGISIDLAFNEQLKGISRMDSLEKILVHGKKERFFTSSEKEQLAEQKNEHYVSLLQDLTPGDLLPGFKPFLEDTKKHQIPCAVASASKNAPFILKKLEILADFDAIVDPSTLTKGKPDPEIFIRAAQALQIEPQDAVGFEDAQAGIDAIKACNMYAVGVIAQRPLQHTDISVKRLDELAVADLIQK